MDRDSRLSAEVCESFATASELAIAMRPVWDEHARSVGVDRMRELVRVVTDVLCQQAEVVE